MPIRGMKNVRQSIDNASELAEKKVRASVLDMFKQIDENSPVADIGGGAFKSSWIYSVGSPASGTNGNLLTQTMSGDFFGKTHYITNNLPYAAIIEYGLFTDKPETEKTLGGFSKQAKKGVAGIAVNRLRSNLKKINRG